MQNRILPGVYFILLIVLTTCAAYFIGFKNYPPDIWSVLGWVLMWLGHLLWLDALPDPEERR